jgi:hypothetical protein
MKMENGKWGERIMNIEQGMMKFLIRQTVNREKR